MICIVFSVNTIIAQTLSSGNYSSSDLGYTYTVIVKQEGNVITITEPNRTNQYKSNGGNTYYHTEQKYSHFYIKVIADNKYYAGKQGGSQQLFTFSGGNTNEEEVLPSGIDDCPLYDKYLDLTTNDHDDAQAWAFCGAAALAKCTYTDVTPYLKPLIQALKSIVEDTSKCPCTDVITQNEWNSVSID
ncbi:hypothetical protein [Flavobacterium sp.]|uniref:hypothetical protein n=1 Tax=Flavobacterium sp. TaxID=239 RepID=UPI0035B3DDFC